MDLQPSVGIIGGGALPVRSNTGGGALLVRRNTGGGALLDKITLGLSLSEADCPLARTTSVQLVSWLMLALIAGPDAELALADGSLSSSYLPALRGMFEFTHLYASVEHH